MSKKEELKTKYFELATRVGHLSYERESLNNQIVNLVQQMMMLQGEHSAIELAEKEIQKEEKPKEDDKTGDK